MAPSDDYECIDSFDVSASDVSEKFVSTILVWAYRSGIEFEFIPT